MRDDKSWILTYSGKRFWPLDPRAEEIDIADIAHALAMKCRFTGHCRKFYSVAQHSVIGSYYCADPLAFLLHDATEAYLPDVATPIKRYASFHNFNDPNRFAEWFDVVEARLARLIEHRFGLPAGAVESQAVKETDLRMYVTERRDLMDTKDTSEHLTRRAEPFPYPVIPWHPEDAEREFHGRFHELTQGRFAA